MDIFPEKELVASFKSPNVSQQWYLFHRYTDINTFFVYCAYHVRARQ